MTYWPIQFRSIKFDRYHQQISKPKTTRARCQICSRSLSFLFTLFQCWVAWISMACVCVCVSASAVWLGFNQVIEEIQKPSTEGKVRKSILRWITAFYKCQKVRGVIYLPGCNICWSGICDGYECIVNGVLTLCSWKCSGRSVSGISCSGLTICGWTCCRKPSSTPLNVNFLIVLVVLFSVAVAVCTLTAIFFSLSLSLSWLSVAVQRFS